MQITPPSSPLQKPSLDPKVESGLRWSMMYQVITIPLNVIGAIAYARFLQPEDLGAFGVAFLVYSGLFLLVQAPIRDAVIYYQEQEEAYASAAFWLLMGLSVVAVAFVMILAGPLSEFYQLPVAAGLTRVIALRFFLQAMAVVPSALLLKRFRFALHESLQAIESFILVIGWVVLAAWGFGAWSLVIAPLIASIFWACAAWLTVDFRPTWSPSREVYGDILRFSRSIFGSKLNVYFRLNLDNAAVATLGAAPLGHYNLGENESAFAIIGVGHPFAQIALPALAALQDNVEEFKQLYLRLLRLVATLSTPLQVGAIVVADLAITLFFGPQWSAAIPVFRAYLLFRLLDVLLRMSNSATSAIGRPDIRFKVDLIQLPFFIAGTWFGLRVWGGVMGVAWSLTIVRLVAGLIYFIASLRVTGLTISQTFRHLLPSSLAALLMGLIQMAIRSSGLLSALLPSVKSPILADVLTLLALTLAGIISYFTMLFALDRQGFKEFVIMAWQITFPDPLRKRLIAIWGAYLPDWLTEQLDKGISSHVS